MLSLSNNFNCSKFNGDNDILSKIETPSLTKDRGTAKKTLFFSRHSDKKL